MNLADQSITKTYTLNLTASALRHVITALSEHEDPDCQDLGAHFAELKEEADGE